MQLTEDWTTWGTLGNHHFDGVRDLTVHIMGTGGGPRSNQIKVNKNNIILIYSSMGFKVFF